MSNSKSKKKNFFRKRNIIALILIALMWCFTIEPNVVTVTKYKIKDESLRGIKVVFAGDFHLKPYQGKHLNYIIDKINAQNPDAVFLIGDYVNMHQEDMSYPIEETAAALASIRVKDHVYTVLGNHDYYSDGKKIKKALEDAGIIVLENRCRRATINGKTVSIVGIEDLTTGFPNLKRAMRFATKPMILLSHQPDIFPMVSENVNLTLAGHLHGGQVVLPFVGALVVPSKYGNKYASGYFEEDGRKMIVTKGLGTSILPIRLNCPPELVVIEFE